MNPVRKTSFKPHTDTHGKLRDLYPKNSKSKTLRTWRIGK